MTDNYSLIKSTTYSKLLARMSLADAFAARNEIERFLGESEPVNVGIAYLLGIAQGVHNERQRRHECRERTDVNTALTIKRVKDELENVAILATVIRSDMRCNAGEWSDQDHIGVVGVLEDLINQQIDRLVELIKKLHVPARGGLAGQRETSAPHGAPLTAIKSKDCLSVE